MQIDRTAKDTLTPVELDVGDSLLLRQADGELRRITLARAEAHVTHRGPILDGSGEVGVLQYRISCTLEIDSVRVELVRRIPSADNFQAPVRVMGLRIWLDAVDEIFEFLDESHGSARPNRAARLAIWEDRARLCPVLLHPWCPLPTRGLRPTDCYRGEDTWLGPFNGREAHGGLDLNHPPGTTLWAPLSIDDHHLFNRVDAGDNNNRWIGTHRWTNGATWVLQSHHLIRLLVPEHTSLAGGAPYAETAGVYCGSIAHTHFVFRVIEEGVETLLDPWLLFWQMYEDRRLTSIAPSDSRA